MPESAKPAVNYPGTAGTPGNPVTVTPGTRMSEAAEENLRDSQNRAMADEFQEKVDEEAASPMESPYE